MAPTGIANAFPGGSPDDVDAKADELTALIIQETGVIKQSPIGKRL